MLIIMIDSQDNKNTVRWMIVRARKMIVTLSTSIICNIMIIMTMMITVIIICTLASIIPNITQPTRFSFPAQERKNIKVWESWQLKPHDPSYPTPTCDKTSSIVPKKPPRNRQHVFFWRVGVLLVKKPIYNQGHHVEKDIYLGVSPHSATATVVARGSLSRKGLPFPLFYSILRGSSHLVSG